MLAALILIVLAIPPCMVLSAFVAARYTVGRGIPTICHGHGEIGGVPVVMYHDPPENRFRQELAYLCENGYETISLDQLADWLDGTAVLPEKPVILTFDDGKKRVYTDAWPLLKEFGCQAVAFVCPYWIRGNAGEDALAPGIQKALLDRVSWDELREMESSGAIDVQAHTLDHHQVWTSDVVTTFMRPEMKLPHVRWDEGMAPAGEESPPLGWPILEHRPRFTHARRFFPADEVMQRCADHVAGNGGSGFFQGNHWEEELRALIGNSDGSIAGRFESEQERVEALKNDLSICKQRLEQELDKSISHLAFPWNQADQTATCLASSLGFRTIVRGKVNGRDICELGDDPLHIPRLTCGDERQYVLYLPGRRRRGRLSLLATMVFAKCSRLFRKA